MNKKKLVLTVILPILILVLTKKGIAAEWVLVTEGDNSQSMVDDVFNFTYYRTGRAYAYENVSYDAIDVFKIMFNVTPLGDSGSNSASRAKLGVFEKNTTFYETTNGIALEVYSSNTVANPPIYPRFTWALMNNGEFSDGLLTAGEYYDFTYGTTYEAIIERNAQNNITWVVRNPTTKVVYLNVTKNFDKTMHYMAYSNYNDGGGVGWIKGTVQDLAVTGLNQPPVILNVKSCLR